MRFGFLAQAGGAGGPGAGGAGHPGGIGGFLGSIYFPLIAFFAITYFLLIRPRQKEQKKHQEMLTSVKKGDHILTTGGIYGLVENVKEKEGILIVKIADKVKIEVARSAVASRVERGSHDYPENA